MNQKQWVWLRRGSQIFFFSAFVAIIWTTRYPLRGFVNPRVFFQLDPLVMLLTSLAERAWLAGLGLTGLTLVVTWIWGRVFCGWFCPLGGLMDFSSWVLSRVLPRRRREQEPSRWRWAKRALLGLLVLLAAAGVQALWFFDPFAIFVRAFSFTVQPGINTGVDRFFSVLLPATHFYPPLDAGYNWLKDVVLDVGNTVFPHAAVIFWIFVALLAAVLIRRRWWCRYACPLGGLLGLVSRHSLLKRESRACSHACGICQNVCRTNAITSDNRTLADECVVCLDCTVRCPGHKTTFTFQTAPKSQLAGEIPQAPGLSRAQFLVLMAGVLIPSSGCRPKLPGFNRQAQVLRPPASLAEEEFVQRCVRCGNCMKVCLTNVLQPAVAEAGWTGIWTPRLQPAIGYCEYQCNLCGQVCPTGAIQPLTVAEKMKTKIGLAEIQKAACIPWALGNECLVCEEHCPVSNKAIKAEFFVNAQGQRVGRPVIDPALCVGCAICENKCPARPRGVRVGVIKNRNPMK
jgi:polyferredoxin/formate hydrogenlyase subunit 6/NADH:ubiquinone oxidoreductase subunit I